MYRGIIDLYIDMENDKKQHYIDMSRFLHLPSSIAYFSVTLVLMKICDRNREDFARSCYRYQTELQNTSSLYTACYITQDKRTLDWPQRDFLYTESLD